MFARFPTPFKNVLEIIDETVATQLPGLARVESGKSLAGHQAVIVHLNDAQDRDRIVAALKKVAVYDGAWGGEPTLECKGRMVIVRSPESLADVSFSRKHSHCG